MVIRARTSNWGDVIRDIELGRCDQRYRTEADVIRDIGLEVM